MSTRKGAEPMCMNCKVPIPGEDYGKEVFQKIILPFIEIYLKSVTDRKKIYCDVPDCKGFSIGSYVKKCSECRKDFGEKTNFRVNSETEKTERKIKESCKNCPGCNVMIFKSDGCDHMFCTLCHTHFNIKTGKKIGIGHNPEYQSWLDTLTDEQKIYYRSNYKLDKSAVDYTKYNNYRENENLLGREREPERYYIDKFVSQCKTVEESKFLLQFQKKHDKVIGGIYEPVFIEAEYENFTNTLWTEKKYLTVMKNKYKQRLFCTDLKPYVMKFVEDCEKEQFDFSTSIKKLMEINESFSEIYKCKKYF